LELAELLLRGRLDLCSKVPSPIVRREALVVMAEQFARIAAQQ
jgi:hypothetical protein